MGSDLERELIRCCSSGVNSRQKGWVARTPLGHKIWSKSSSRLGEVVNLRIARKRAARGKTNTRAAEKRLQHGQSKAQRTLAKTQKAKAQRDLDQRRIDRGEGK